MRDECAKLKTDSDSDGTGENVNLEHIEMEREKNTVALRFLSAEPHTLIWGEEV